ncbi:MAG TPA: CDP-glucose 4,6-dehydratase [Gemmatimonadaceae bacterium]|nr:CDP-glucose 4,6-dehydratase [Gemmatimonadaceae bacterium]
MRTYLLFRSCVVFRMRAAPNPSYWRGRRVFLTGHTGFKGSWLALWLDALGAKVTGYALQPATQPNLYEQARVSAGLHDVIADVRDFPRLAVAVAECRPEVVIHMAAQAVVRRGYADPIETYSTNVMGTVNLLEAVRRLGAGCVVVNVTSDKCYAPRESGTAYREDDPMGGDDPYASSKACAELVTTAYRQSFFPPPAAPAQGVALASVRAGNVIGGGDWTTDRIIPDLIRSFASSRPCPVRSPDGIRPWQFVLEPLRGYLMLAERLAADGTGFTSAWNFGPIESDAKPVRWIADRVKSLWGGNASWVTDTNVHPPEVHALRLDASKAAATLGWHPALSLEAALEWIVEWYRAWDRRGDLGRLARMQIERYEQLLS